jgi:hypothetical protein
VIKKQGVSRLLIFAFCLLPFDFLKGAALFLHIPGVVSRNCQMSLLFFVLAAGTLACANQSASSRPLADATPTPTASPDGAPRTTPFDGDRAFAHVKTQVGFGPRPAGSAALEKTREYLIRELKSFGLNVTVDEFTPLTPQGKVRMKNVVAELPGESPDVVIISSHYDTKPFKEFTFVGANDGGSSTGALLEIARVMSGQGRRKFTYHFVFFDGEEAFCHEWSECLGGKDNTYGSRHMVEQLRREKQLDHVKAVILLDMIGDKDLTVPRDQTSSGWMVETIWPVASELGYSKEFPSRPFSVGDDDHLPFLRAGIPAVDIIDFEYGEGPEDNRYWHTAEDTLDKLSPRSLKIVGDVVLSSLGKIEAQIR